MAEMTYAKALAAVLVHEGGKVDHPDDPGGRTNQGVIQRVYDGYRKRKGLKTRDVYLMADHERDEIYRAQYWDVIRGDDLPAGVEYVVFDGAVNSGPSQSVKWLQRALGTVAVDGQIGEATLAAVEAHRDHDLLIAAICERRMAFLQALKTWKSFGKGWTARVSGVRKRGQAWASGSVGPVPVFAAGGNAKALIGQAAPVASPAAGDVATGGGFAGIAAGGALKQAQEALAPLTGSGGWIDGAVAVLVIAGAAVTLGGILWRLRARRNAAQQTDALDLAVPA